MSYDREAWLRRKMREEALAQARAQVADEYLLEVKRADRERARADAAELALMQLRRDVLSGATRDARLQELSAKLAAMHARHAQMLEILHEHNSAVKIARDSLDALPAARDYALRQLTLLNLYAAPFFGPA